METTPLIEMSSCYTHKELKSKRMEITGYDPNGLVKKGVLFVRVRNGENLPYKCLTVERRNHSGKFKDKELSKDSFYTAIVKLFNK